MKTAYFDCFNGAAGDMIVASLVDAGADANVLRERIAALGISGYSIDFEKTKRGGLSATRFVVSLDQATKQPHRHLKHILDILESSSLSPSVRKRSARVFERLAEAEAKVHGTTIEKVHFHEVGAVDAIIDVVAGISALDLLSIDQVMVSPIPTGSGTIQCAHGAMPIPAPATAELLRGVPLAATDAREELTTPTGAALLTTLASGFGPLPPMTLQSVGYGAGSRDTPGRANVLRVLIGMIADDAEVDQIAVLETNLDDASPQQIAFCMDRLFEAGALDAFTLPIQMKKSRPGTQLTVLCEPGLVSTMERILFVETPTFGIRKQMVQRSKLRRHHETVPTIYGDVRMKIGEYGDLIKAAPEYEDCKVLALSKNVSLQAVIDAARTAWLRKDEQSLA